MINRNGEKQGKHYLLSYLPFIPLIVVDKSCSLVNLYQQRIYCYIQIINNYAPDRY